MLSDWNDLYSKCVTIWRDLGADWRAGVTQAFEEITLPSPAATRASLSVSGHSQKYGFVSTTIQTVASLAHSFTANRLNDGAVEESFRRSSGQLPRRTAKA